MRLDIVLVAVFLAASPAFGHGRGVVAPKLLPQGRLSLDLSNLHLHLFHEPSSEDSDTSAAGSANSSWSQAKAFPNISMGALHAQFGTDDNPRANLSSYKLLGMDQLGSSMWHNQQGRSAKLLFVWPTEK